MNRFCAAHHLCRVLPLLFVLVLAPASAPAQTADLPAFPTDFVGNWRGELRIFNASGQVQAVPMELLIQPVNDSTYTYTIIYGTDREAGKRDYYLVRGADGPHHWICDEKNSLLLDGYYLGGSYRSVFTVQGSYLLANLEHRGDALEYSIQSGSTTPVRSTGGAPVDGEDIPVVEAFRVGGYQAATLRRY
ncbi:hypothetical protein QWY85_09745 [Neolewinella lacunae]|uniref:Lipocalin-like domain-containing protein n=1 Tax=Neolewinella lacunae TaxID=1517758 RepID=A0A923TD04_9BACT|nr:hypothetical protein [Neolewinella lacunae]MBC6994302.1 hypothetical protein [Neolewinella lacunae]MDN3634941.1 hypothetical protein [Neolewinella lacunae]